MIAVSADMPMGSTESNMMVVLLVDVEGASGSPEFFRDMLRWFSKCCLSMRLRLGDPVGVGPLSYSEVNFRLGDSQVMGLPAKADMFSVTRESGLS